VAQQATDEPHLSRGAVLLAPGVLVSTGGGSARPAATAGAALAV